MTSWLFSQVMHAAAKKYLDLYEELTYTTFLFRKPLSDLPIQRPEGRWNGRLESMLVTSVVIFSVCT